MTNTLTAGRIVVGYDGRWQGTRILDVAAAEAERRRLPLSLVTLIHAPDEVAAADSRPADRGWTQTVVRHRLDDAVHHIHARRPALRIASHCLTYADATADQEPFTSAALLVLGDRGNHGVPVFSSGSPSRRLTLAVTCPVMIVPDAGPARLVTSASQGSSVAPGDGGGR